jgi:HSP20 family molecular chaperone IbpA
MPLPSILDQIDQLFDELVHRPWGTAARQLVPAELREVKDGWVVELPVQGLRAADLTVQVEGRRLVIRGHRRHEQEQRHGEKGWSRTQQETSLHRTITLPTAADPDAIEASVEDSTLTIHIGRREP